MKHLASIILLTIATAVATSSRALAQNTDSLTTENGAINIGTDTTIAMTDSLTTDWWGELMHGHIDFEHKRIKYPKFLETCIDVYNWGDRTFNSYDTTYITGIDRKWKVMIKNTNWFDNFFGHVDPDRFPINTHSRIISNFGARVSFMAVGAEYMVNVRDLLKGKSIKNTRLKYSFTTSRFTVEFNYIKNRSETHLSRLGDYFDRKLIGEYNYNGFKREIYGVDFAYIFNHNRYCEGAPYCFSKIQRRSAGSLLAGISIWHHDIKFNFESLSDEMKEYLPENMTDCRFRYRDYSLMVGYGYSFALPHQWLINVTAMPEIGYRESFPNSIEGKNKMLSTGIKAKFAVVHNHGRFFYGAHMVTNSSWYYSSDNRFTYFYHDIDFAAGFRF